tara:strand:- start:1228 stop:1524 length:297 start_codon:yes stop_codon:yes gene_type:complete
MLNEDKLKIESATFQKLLEHLRNNPDVQNIDMMNLANFCRNCISKWYMSESEKIGIKISYDEARELIYGMPYTEFKEKYQKEATKEQLDKFNERKSDK